MISLLFVPEATPGGEVWWSAAGAACLCCLWWLTWWWPPEYELGFFEMRTIAALAFEAAALLAVADVLLVFKLVL